MKLLSDWKMFLDQIYYDRDNSDATDDDMEISFLGECESGMENTFIFEFHDSNDSLSIYEHCLWNFDKTLLVLKPFQYGTVASKIDFNLCHFQIHVMSLPHCSINNGRKIGKVGFTIGELVDLEMSHSSGLVIKDGELIVNIYL